MGYNYAGSDEFRQSLLQESREDENMQRKTTSFEQIEIFKDRLRPFVKKYLQSFYSVNTVCEIPIVSSVNLARRIVKQEASIYSREPKRTFSGVTEDQAKVLEQVYKDMGINTVLRRANEMFKLQEQSTVQVLLSAGQLKGRVLYPHQIDVIPSPDDPETADGYMVNGFDRTAYVPRLVSGQNERDQKIADVDDYKSSLKRIAWWSEEQNFVTDETGAIVSGQTPAEITNPIGVIPFVDIAGMKDGEFWVRPGESISDFTIQFNGSLSDLGHIVRMQGFAQAWMKGPAGMIPQNVQVGPSFVIKLPIDPNNPVETDFGFASPNPDLAGSIEYVETVLSAFLTARGLDPKLVNGSGDGQKFTSGLERLLAMIDAFEPSRSDYDVFRHVECRLFKIVAAYLNTYSGTQFLKYTVAPINDNADVSVQYADPEAIQSDSEKVAGIRERRDLAIMSRTEAVMKDRGISEDEAEKIIAKIDEEDGLETEEPKEPAAE